jgi:hypothetical protein
MQASRAPSGSRWRKLVFPTCRHCEIGAFGACTTGGNAAYLVADDDRIADAFPGCTSRDWPKANLGEGSSRKYSRKRSAPFGIKVTIIEPGGFRTDFAGSSTTIRGGLPEHDSTVGAVARFQRGYNGAQPGDPSKAAAVIIQSPAWMNHPSGRARCPRRVVFHGQKLDQVTRAEDLCQVPGISFGLRAVCHLRTASPAWAGEIAWPRPTRPCLASRCALSANTIRSRVALPPAKPHERYENGLRIVSPSIAWPSRM